MKSFESKSYRIDQKSEILFSNFWEKEMNGLQRIDLLTNEEILFEKLLEHNGEYISYLAAVGDQDELDLGDFDEVISGLGFDSSNFEEMNLFLVLTIHPKVNNDFAFNTFIRKLVSVAYYDENGRMTGFFKTNNDPFSPHRIITTLSYFSNTYGSFKSVFTFVSNREKEYEYLERAGDFETEKAILNILKSTNPSRFQILTEK